MHVQEMGYLARSFKNSVEGKAIAAECEARVVESGGVVNKDRKMDKVRGGRVRGREGGREGGQ